MKIETHYDNIVKKPWGYEYLVFGNEKVALWYLFISAGHKTSMHCHPNKTTGLMVLDGKCEVSFFSNKYIVNELDKVMIRKSLFHSTESISQNGSSIFEIETPNDKNDLVRFDDSYGRIGQPYEGKEFEYPKLDNCLAIDENFNLNMSKFANCNLSIYDLNSVDFFQNFDDSVNFIMLNGGINTDYNVTLVNPGDIINNKIAKNMTKIFRNIIPGTKLLLASKNNN